jgi:hypothetical protein
VTTLNGLNSSNASQATYFPSKTAPLGVSVAFVDNVNTDYLAKSLINVAMNFVPLMKLSIFKFSSGA